MTVAERSYAPLSEVHYARLAEIVSMAHADLRKIRPDLSGQLAAACLAQGAAGHVLDPSIGVKDVDLWLFYVGGPGARRAPARRLKTYDFGRSSLGRHPADVGYQGRRVDVMCRTASVAVGTEPAQVVLTWLGSGTTSARQLRARPVVLVWPRADRGRVVWSGERRLDAIEDMSAAMRTVEGLTTWSPWVPFEQAVVGAPREPGVYLAREGQTGPVVYAGKAGPRDRGGMSSPKGIRGRLAVYATGKALASGLGEVVFDRAIADPAWLRARLAETESGNARRALVWGQEAFARADLHIRWSVTKDERTALALEAQVRDLLRAHGLWNRV